jgi:putative solute:sodium symporter small subunit
MGDHLRRHWRDTRRLSAALLGAWFVVSFGPVYFARELSFDFFGWPFGWWMAAQGAQVVYLLIVGGYARAMRRLDDEHGVCEDR